MNDLTAYMFDLLVRYMVATSMDTATIRLDEPAGTCPQGSAEDGQIFDQHSMVWNWPFFVRALSRYWRRWGVDPELSGTYRVDLDDSGAFVLLGKGLPALAALYGVREESFAVRRFRVILT